MVSYPELYCKVSQDNNVKLYRIDDIVKSNVKWSWTVNIKLLRTVM